jgi:hypothetical protein
MFNIIGKALVLVYAACCLAGLALAVMVFFEFIDWGRAEPRVQAGESTKSGSNDLRIASEFDKSVVIYNDAVASRNLALLAVPPAENALREIESYFGKNHLFYVDELKKLRVGDGAVDVKAIPADGIPTDKPGKPYGKPVPELEIKELTKSLSAYTAELRELLKKDGPVAKLEEAIGKLAEENEKISYQLTGKKDGKKKNHGIYDLVEEEFQTQQLHKSERDYLQPQWAATVEEARRFSLRHDSLTATLAGLEKVLNARKLPLPK